MTSIEKNRSYYVMQIMALLKNYIPNLLLAVIMKAGNMIIPYLIVIVIGNFVGELCGGQTLEITRYILKLAGLLLAAVGFSYFDTYVSHDMSFRIVRKLRNLCYEKIERILPATKDNKSLGDYGRIVNGDVDVFEWFYAHIFVAWIATAVSIVAGCILIWQYHPAGLIIAGVCSGAVVMIPKLHTAEAEEKGYILRKFGGELNAVIVDGILGMKDVISNQFMEDYNNNLLEKSEQFDKAREKYSISGIKEKRMTELIIDAGILFSLCIAFLYDNMNIGEKFSFVLLLTSFFAPLQQTLRDGTNYGFVFGAAKRVYDLLNEEEYVADKGTMTAEEVIQKSKDIKKWCFSIQNVSFRYPDSPRDVLQGVTFDIKAGESVALAAASGGGKTTLANLMQRFWEYQSGSILLNGIDIKEIKLSEWRKLITVVSQEIYLFHASIRENLLMAKQDADEEELIAACKMANAWDFICEMPEGMDTQIGERGESLSGGQRQRLALAQAFLKDAPILVMDEATSNLDVFNEKGINEAVKKIKNEKIILTIAHRVATIQSADKIIFLEHGVLKECNTFENLIHKSKAFKSLIGKKAV